MTLEITALIISESDHLSLSKEQNMEFLELNVGMHVQMAQPPGTCVSSGTLVSAAKIVPTHYFGVKSIYRFQMMMLQVHLDSLTLSLTNYSKLQ